MSTSYKLGDLVWAKMKGCSPWPGRVSVPTHDLKPPRNGSSYVCIYFFGTSNHDWVRTKRIKPYEKYKKKMMKYCNTAAYKDAINKMEEYIENPEIFSNLDGTIQIQENNHLPKEMVMKIKDEPQDLCQSVCKQEKITVAVPSVSTARVILDRIEIFQCEDCSLCFLQTWEYRLHKLIHVKEAVNQISNAQPKDDRVRNYKCEECGVKFVLKSTLAEHSVLHMPMPHICECGIGYYLKKDLNAHMLLVHPPKIPTWTAKINYHGPKEKTQDFVIQTYSEPKQIKTKLGMVSKVKANLNLKKKNGPKLKAELTLKSNSRHKPRAELMFKSDNGTELSLSRKSTRPPRLQANIVDRTPISRNQDNRFVCPVCDKTFMAKTGVEFHLRSHYGDKRYACQECDKRFVQESARNNHLKRHYGIRDFACEFCDKRFYSKCDLVLHTRTHTGEKPYNCPYCGKDFSDPSAYARHERTHTGYKPYACEKCPKTFSDAGAFSRHRKRHTGKKDISCEICGKMFYERGNMLNHLMSIHDGRKKFECDYCCKRFVLKGYLKMHMELVHFPKKTYECNDCGKKCTTKNNLVGHIHRIHCEVLYCHVCMKKFFNERELQHHKKLNNCNAVEYRKKTKSRNHLVQNYECDRCSKVYVTKKRLQCHLKFCYADELK